jgi:ABC-type polysaccharide/polyol phosphate export permease
MFRPEVRKTPAARAFALFELIFHVAVRNVRKTNGNAIVGLLLTIIQAVMMIVVLLVLFDLMGMRATALRGDFVLYLMSGVFCFATHAKTLSAVSKSDGPTSSMMKHSPMNTIVAVGAAALGTLYLQTLSAAVILYFYHTIWTPITIYNPAGMVAMFLLSWASGIGIGMMFKAATPWQPEFFGVATSLYARANMIFSGKMVLANSLTPKMLALYSWNPLFHCIDQNRGFMFENYHPHNSSISYPIVMTAIFILLGLMGENFTNKHASSSWSAKR